MRPILLENFRIPARRIAELMWGRGGTHYYKTNRRGAYYYSCAGHGGYVVDSRCLTTEELQQIDKYTEPEQLPLLTQISDQNKKFVVGVFLNNFSCKAKNRFTYNRFFGSASWENFIKIYLFEEDCDWSILEKYTNIRAKGGVSTQETIDRTFDTWIAKRCE